MSLGQETAVEQIVCQLMSRLGRNSLQSQALLQAYCGVVLSGYPTMEDAGIIDGGGSFLVAGERIKLLQKESVQRARSALIEIRNSNASNRETIDKVTKNTFEDDCFHSFLKRIADGTGNFLENVGSSP